jgi:hypothetical protein
VVLARRARSVENLEGGTAAGTVTDDVSTVYGSFALELGLKF